MFCAKCGKENQGDAVFCKYCGAKIGSDQGPNSEVPGVEHHLPQKKLSNRVKVVLGIVIAILVFVIADTAYIKYKRRFIDLYDIAQKSEDYISQHFRMDAEQSYGEEHVYIIDEHGAMVTFNDEKEGSVTVSLMQMPDDLRDADVKYSEKYHSIAGYRPGNKRSDVDADRRFKNISEYDHGDPTYGGKVYLYEEVSNPDGILQVYCEGDEIKNLTYHKYDGQHDDLYRGITGETSADVEDETQEEKEEVEEETSNQRDAAKPVSNSNLINIIEAYYSTRYGTNNVAGEVDHEDGDTVTIRLYTPDTNAVSSTLGFYDYNKQTGTWRDSITCEELDIDVASEPINETASSHSGQTEESLGGYYTSDADRTGATSKYVVINSPSDGYANIRYEPGLNSDIKYQWENGAILDYLDETVTTPDGRQWYYVGFYYWDDYDGGSQPRYMDGYISSKVCDIVR